MGLIDEQNVTNHMGIRINPTAQFQPATHVCMLKDAECGTDTFLLCLMFIRLAELRSVLQGLTELILSQKYHTVYIHMGPICNGC